MIRKTCVLWKYISPAVFSEVGFHSANGCRYSWNSLRMSTRCYSSDPIFKVRKRILWDEPFEQQACNEPETSSALQEDESKGLVDLNNTEPKTLADATILNHLHIKKIQETLQQLDEQAKHENFFRKITEKWNLKLELRKARSMRRQDQVIYTKEMLANLDRSAAQLYFDCANRFPYLKLCTALCLPDYLSTWYKLTLMHTWMLLVRLQSVLEAAAFIRLRNSVIEIMFGDVDKRLRVVSEELHEMLYHKSDRRRMAGLYLQTFLEYDEGFLCDDTTLAGALWRNLYMQRSVDPVHLNRAVYYVRGTMAYLDSLNLEEILLQGIKNWKIACSDRKFSDKNAFEVAEDIAYSLMKQKYKHT
ncbi:ubiquinol-cytochrome C chaperone family protein [Loa loa]|uniref:Ubiquinol-cytochrome C chaperone family protein n=1 Tax=Loa loa TaxID=7209 RepID=A0A1I7VWJ5_LOALO|nr:ubiquinol-cytochrome C chaperone family protein [Loa loa]EFO21541.2 ubiquinol-cytochrome C chaperone family protein [Loa loa]